MSMYPFGSSNLFQHCLSQNSSLSWMFFGCYTRCDTVLTMGCLPSSSNMSPNLNRVNVEMHSKAVIERTSRLYSHKVGDAFGGCDRASLEICTWRPCKCQLRGRNRAGLEMHLVAMIVRCWTPQLSEFGDALGGHDWASLQICTWRPWEWELGGCDFARLEMYMEAIIKWHWRSTWGWSI